MNFYCYFVWGKVNKENSPDIKLFTSTTLAAAKSFIRNNERYYKAMRIEQVNRKEL